VAQHSIFLISFLVQKNTTNKSQIGIPKSFAYRAKVNLEAINASSNL
jgi:hypothetical protein